MKRIAFALFVVTFLCSTVFAQSLRAEPAGFWSGLQTAIQKHLGRPYVWGATGLKSFDCSGFVWRVMYENGILLKRTTARKLYLTLPKATPEWPRYSVRR